MILAGESLLVIILAIISGIIGILAALLLYWKVQRYPMGTPRMREIWSAIREGSKAYMSKQIKTIMSFTVGLAVAVIIMIYFVYTMVMNIESGLALREAALTGVSVLIGGAASVAAAFFSMDASTRTNVRVTEAGKKSSFEALKLSILGGGVLGFSVYSLSLLGLAVLFLIYSLISGGLAEEVEFRMALDALAGFAFGASLSALFAQLGGGIYTKSADIGADLVGKIEAGIPEDDPRNPAVIADQVGDNVGDCAGRGADIFESVTAETLGGMIIGWVLYVLTHNQLFMVLPLAIGAVGIISTIAGILGILSYKNFKEPFEPMSFGIIVSAIVSIITYGAVVYWLFPGQWSYMLAAGIAGIAGATLVVLSTNRYTGLRSGFVHSVAEASQSGPALNIISGLSVGMRAVAEPIIVIAAALGVAFYAGKVMPIPGLEQNWLMDFIKGVFGTALATRGMLSLAGTIMTLDGAGPIADNAGGIAEMAELEEDVRANIEPLDAVGNTTKALTKGYAMASATIATLLLFQAFIQDYVAREVGITALSAESLLKFMGEFLNSLLILKPDIIIAVLIGALLPYYFSGVTLKAVGKAAFQMVEEVRRQFREIPGLLEGKAKPDYYRAVAISTENALKSMALPAMTIIITPLIIGLLFGGPGIGALVIGATASTIPLAIMMMWGGATWDNAKKYIEAGNLGGKGSEAHKAAVVGDTVGDPLKDTVGPSLHILIKLLNTISLVFIPLYMLWLLQGIL
ncbi:MAG: sodium-translocating pyrophosphatase [Thaumarchaeota archaeon]|nr:MAG: sodium-translocating pyrophosphatase [Nitrososphaerota archaeon]HDD39663.1 sodium-translocating pyrophosphatase [Nitrososphaeria archaeon]